MVNNSPRKTRSVGLRRRWTKLLSLAVVLSAVALMEAVHLDGVFELDRDATNAGTVAGEDWDNVFAGNDTADASSFVVDGEGPTIFTTGGSKDDLDTTGWKHKDGSSPDKDELLNAYAARYGDVIYFGADRTSNDGDAVMGFWFFQENVVPQPGGSFGPGKHKDGDILLLSDFSGGGGTVTIRVFRWNGPGGTIAGQGAINGTLDLLAGGLTPADCIGPPAVPNTSPFCGTVNTAVVASPWDFDPKVGPPGFFQTGLFYEGGIDLAFLNLQDECFSSFLAETRSSTSVNSTLKDFVGGGFESCGSGLVTTPKDAAGASIPAGGVSITTAGSIQVKDSAVLTITGPTTWSGNLNFFLCGPADLVTQSTCITGGTGPIAPAVGNPVNQATASPILSALATITSAGTYCWRAEFTGISPVGVPNSTDSATTECFLVNPVVPGVATSAQGTNGAPVPLGTTLFDVATVTPVANQPGTPVINPTTAGLAAGGTVTFNLYGPMANPASPVCTTPIGTATVPLVATAGTGQGTASTNGVTPNAGGTFTPTTAGTYVWVASYSGNTPNTSAPLGPQGCGDTGEVIVVTPNSPSIVTTASAPPPTGAPLGTALTDSAELSGATATAGGTITFTLYGPVATNTPTCTALVGTSAPVPVSGNGTYVSGAPASGTFTPTLGGFYFWIAAYSGDLPNNQPFTSQCGAANETSLLISLDPTVSTSQWFLPNDTATITVATGGGALAGTVRFRVFTSADCTTGLVYDSGVGGIDVATGTGDATNRTVETNNVNKANRVTGTTTVYWLVEFDSTNPSHTDASSPCGKERTTLTVNNNFTP